MIEFLRVLRKLQQIYRFSTRDVIRPEPVMGHSGCVALIAYYFAKYDGNNEDVCKSILWFALIHDLDESYTGDFCHEFKYGEPKVREAVERAGDNFLSRLSTNEILDDCDLTCPKKAKYIKDYIKIGDFVELLMYCGAEYAKGNRNLEWTFRRGVDLIKGYKKYSSVKWFLEETNNGEALKEPQRTLSSLSETSGLKTTAEYGTG